jgi:hypothetical protein
LETVLSQSTPATRSKPLIKRLWGRLRVPVTLFLGLLAATWSWLYFSPALEIPSERKLPAQAQVQWADPPMFKQGEDECGPYSLDLAIRVCGQRARAQDLVDELKLTVPGIRALTGTPPWRLRDALCQRGLSAGACSARAHPKGQELRALEEHLSLGSPVLVLIQSPRGFQHWVVALGYGPDSIDFYDPGHDAEPENPDQTKDENGPRPGNLSWSKELFREHWSRGGAIGLYHWYYIPLISTENLVDFGPGAPTAGQ